jgi:hypothetical protein
MVSIETRTFVRKNQKLNYFQKGHSDEVRNQINHFFKDVGAFKQDFYQELAKTET